MDLTPYLADMLAAYAILVLASFSPGPAVAMLVGMATRLGRTPALTATLGIAFGSMSINILTMLGVGLILSEAAWAMTALRMIGAAYLLYLAYGSFQKAARPPELQSVASDSRTLARHFMTGYLLQVTNPKAIAFWLAIASIGAVDGAAPGVIVLFVAGAFTISFFCHGFWAVALSIGLVRQLYNAGRRWIEVALGCVFVFAAFKLASSEN